MTEPSAQDRAAYVERARAAAERQGKGSPTDHQLEAIARILVAHLREKAKRKAAKT